MLPTKVNRPPCGGDWSFELKLDGIRAFAIIEDGVLTIQSRNGTNMTSWFPELAPISEFVAANNAVVDGEIIVRDGSVKSFNTLLERARARGSAPLGEPVTFVAFDALEIDRVDITDLPLDARRERLYAIVREHPRLVLSQVFQDGATLYTAAIALGLEGIVAKKRRSKYERGRSRWWVKVSVPGAAERHEWTGAPKE